MDRVLKNKTKNSRGKVSQLPGEKNYPLNAERVTPPNDILTHYMSDIKEKQKKKAKKKQKLAKKAN